MALTTDDLNIYESGTLIAEVHCDHISVDKAGVYARQFAAAPDLLAACKAMVAQFSDAVRDPCDEEALAAAHAAIAKAEGQEAAAQ